MTRELGIVDELLTAWQAYDPIFMRRRPRRFRLGPVET